jgi:transposase
MKAYSVDLRQKIIDVYNSDNLSQRQLAQRFRVTLSFIQKLVKQYRKTGNIAPKVRIEQTPTKLKAENLNVLQELVNANNDATLEELRHQLAQKTGILIGRSTVDRMLKRLNITRKKTLHATEKGTERVQNQRLDFWTQVQNILAKNLIFIDESGVNLALVRLFARSNKGQRAYGDRPNKRGKNVSVIGALCLNGMLAQCSLLGGTDALTFEAFISQKLVPKLWAGACVIMDNCSIHKGNTIRNLIENTGATLLYLPTYSPEFNPIENCWSKIKSILRQISARTYSDLVKALQFAFAQISQDEIKNWFTHCCYCTSLD